jgi:hypothetical protein
MAAKSITAAAAGGCAEGWSAELKLAGGNGSTDELLAWRSASGLAIAGGLIFSTAAAAETDREDVGGRDSASATTLELPAVCLRSEVNSAKKERCLCCRFDHGGETRVMAETKGL